MQKRALENQKRAPENCHRMQCNSLFIVADLVNGMWKVAPEKRKKNSACISVLLFYIIFFFFFFFFFFFYVWQSPGLPGWRKVNLITVTHRPHHPSIAAGLYCLTTSPGLLPALCEKWSGFFYVHRVLLSYTRDRRLKVSSERLGNEDKAPCPRTLLPGWGSNRGPPGWTSEVLTARPRQLLMII